MGRHRNDTLFYDGDIRPTLDNILGKAVEEVAGLKPDYLLKVSEEDLIASLTEKYALEPLELIRDQMVADGPREVDIDMSHNPRFARLHGERSVVRGTAVTIIVPFRGSPILFKLKPSQWNTNIPRGQVVDQELRLEFQGVEMDAQQIKRDSDFVLNNIRQFVEWQHKDVVAYNEKLATTLRKAVQGRKGKLLKDMNLVAGLGIPMRRRDVPETFVVPTVRRKPKIELPAVAPGSYKPEPILAHEHYNFILKVLHDMALVMERSPSAFQTMEEEHLRDHFLVALNGHFEGAATGETFNFEGKTDILIRYEGRNVFIAECKFWRGDKSFTATIDQLLGYVCWRDTKTAILIFNRNKDTTKVLAKIPELVKAHPNFKRELPQRGETEFQYVLHHRDDANRELIVTVMVFDVLGQSGAAEADSQRGRA